MPRISESTRTKWCIIGLAVPLFASLGGLTNRALGHSLFFGLVSAALLGLAISVFELFYVQARQGRWLRLWPTSRALPAYLVVVVLVSVLSRVVTHMLFGSPADLPRVYERLPATLAFCLVISGIGVLAMRVLRHVGVETLMSLALGTSSRPILRRKILMFVDMNGSTAFAERLGAFRTHRLFETFALDLSPAIERCDGTVHHHKGDGLVAVWDWNTGRDSSAVMAAVDGMFAAVARNAAYYRCEFGAVPSFRVGVHGGDVVLSDTADLKRALGIYGDVVHITARIEEAAREHRICCCVSDVVVRSLGDLKGRFRLIGMEQFRGVQVPIDLYEFKVSAPNGIAEAPHQPSIEFAVAASPGRSLIAPVVREGAGLSQGLYAPACDVLSSMAS